jgi:hypothetical protein
MAFNAVYFMPLYKYTLSIENVFNIIKILSISLLLGISFIFLRIIWLFIKNRDINLVWNTITRYDDYKIILLDGEIIRNMKPGKFLIKSKSHNHVITSAQKLEESGLTMSGRTVHPVVRNVKTKIAAVHTTKEQKDIEHLLLDKKDQSRAYAQIVTDNNKFIMYENVMRKDIKELLITRGTINMVAAHAKIKNSNNDVIVVNHNNKQSFTNINNEMKKEASEFIEICGGDEKVSSAIDFNEHCTNVLENAKKIINDLLNEKKSEKKEIIEMSNNLKEIMDSEANDGIKKTAEKLLEKITELI